MPLALLQLFFVFFERMATAAQQGHVPVKFVLAREEIAANDAPPPCYVSCAAPGLHASTFVDYRAS